MRRVLFFGIYDPNYSRNAILRSGFEANGFVVEECRIDPKITTGLKKYYELWKLGRQKKKEDWDLIIVAFPGQTVMPLARLLFPKNKIVFDAFVSLYDSNVFDRGRYGRFSFSGLKDWFLDWLGCQLAGIILLDTYEHIKYFIATFHQPADKFIRVLVGANDKVFYPRPKPALSDMPFIVYFCGHFIPLQGIEYIIAAAEILKSEPIEFRLVGSGQTYQKIVAMIADKQLSDKVKLLGEKDLAELPDLMIRAHVCLGIFGNTPKAARVIPNKVYESIAMGCPVITMDSPAEREIFTDGQEILFCRPADGRDLADKILKLRDNKILRESLANGGWEYFEKNLTPTPIVRELINNLEKRHV